MRPALGWISAIVLGAGGCTAMKVQSGPTAGIPGTGTAPGFGGGGVIPTTPGRTTSGSSDQVCRNQSIPRGWIAVDYLPSSTCPPMGEGGESGPNSALLVRHLDLPPETLLTVCADQRVPVDWIRAKSEDIEGPAGRCPRRSGDKPPGPTVMRIRRVR